jgi:hypothetical protein
LNLPSPSTQVFNLPGFARNETLGEKQPDAFRGFTLGLSKDSFDHRTIVGYTFQERLPDFIQDAADVF